LLFLAAGRRVDDALLPRAMDAIGCRFTAEIPLTIEDAGHAAAAARNTQHATRSGPDDAVVRSNRSI
jgi:hypothetical protein